MGVGWLGEKSAYTGGCFLIFVNNISFDEGVSVLENRFGLSGRFKKGMGEMRWDEMGWDEVG